MAARKLGCSLSLVLLLGAFVGHSTACVYLMGEAMDSIAPHPAGTHWAYEFKGDDWTGADATNTSWVCHSGKKQSPVNLHGLSSIHKSQEALRTKWWYAPATSNGSDIEVYNNGHTIQVQWAAGKIKSSVRIQTAGSKVTDVLAMHSTSKAKAVMATPLQFHFHTDSEHTVDGQWYPMEMHIVHSIPQSELPACPATGCLTVTGIMWKLDDDDKDNPWLDTILSLAPEHEGYKSYFPKGTVLDIQKLLPTIRSYAQYEGSLTTPPCTEGLLWHVLTKPQTMSLRQLRMYSRAVGFKECELIEAAKTGRRLAGAGHHHHHHHHAPGGDFVRGSYSGFKTLPTGARLLAETNAPLPKYNCTVAAYGYTNRLPQPLNDRDVLVFK